jgi:hypothetical protein
MIWHYSASCSIGKLVKLGGIFVSLFDGYSLTRFRILPASFEPLQFCLDGLSDEFRAPVRPDGGVDAFLLTGEKPNHKLFQIHFWSATMRHAREIILIVYRVKTPLLADHI